MAILAHIDNIPILATLPVKWELRSGVVPVHNVYDFSINAGNTIEKKRGKPVTLTIDDRGNNKKVEIQGLYILHELPSDNQHIRRFIVADRRWLWPYKHIRRIYNKRRKIGFKRIKDAADKTPEIQPVVEELSYAPFSLELDDGVRRKKALSFALILSDLVNAITENEEAYSGTSPRILSRKSVAKLAATPIEEMFLDESLDMALNRVMEYMPGLDVFVNYRGNVIFYNKNSGADSQIIQQLGHEVVGGGHITVVDFSFIAPKEMNIYFDRKIEIRLDHSESDAMTQSAGMVMDADPAIEDQEQRMLDNVLPISDYSLAVAGKTLAQGNWITIPDAIAAYNALGELPGLGKLTSQLIRRAMVPFMDFWAGLHMLGQLVPDADWGSRLATIQSFYRRAFRIRQNLWERLLEIEPSRVATFDPTTGQRGTSTVYCNYYAMATDRSMLMDRGYNHDQELAYGMNFAGRPLNDSVSATIDSTTPAAPARVTILDPDQGIIGIDFAPDVVHIYDQFAPGSLEINGTKVQVNNHNLPVKPGPRMGTPFRPNWTQFFNSIPKIEAVRDSLPQLSATWNLSIIISALLGSPNTERALHKVTVTPADVGKILGNFQAHGPAMDVRVGSAIETARIAWKDSERERLEKVIGIRQGDPGNIDDLVINFSHTTKPGGASLRQIAVATAARIWATYLKRPVGSATGAMNPNISLDGWINEIEIQLATTGQTSTQVSLPERLPKLSMWSLLPADVRHFTMKLVKAR